MAKKIVINKINKNISEPKKKLVVSGPKIELKALLDAGCHFGHQSQRWNPKMANYLYGIRDGVHIFDLVKTKTGLEKAVEFAKEIASKGGKIIFVGTKRQSQSIIKEEALKAKMPFVSERWLGGILTNWGIIKKSINKLKDLKEQKASGELAKKFTKKENILIDREITRLERFFGGLVDLKDLPAALFVIDVKKEKAALQEASKKGIPVIAVVDSNVDPDLVNCLIPANDDAVGSVKLIVGLIAEAIIQGNQIWEKTQKKV
ncbi:MAG: 30S ribosomal protein S2 [Candidatus Shapirobacteria bacterium]|nr:30S ribosomal protein S2 [Candidatus Shapirobacteria bacterium]